MKVLSRNIAAKLIERTPVANKVRTKLLPVWRDRGESGNFISERRIFI